MTYKQAIKGAKKAAKKNNRSYVVIQLPKRRWWNRKRYDYFSICHFEEVRIVVPIIRLLTITPTGTIAQ